MNTINDIQLPLYTASSNGARANESANKLAVEDAPFHEWYRFVLSFPSHLVRQYVDEFGITSEQLVLDPFCGTGTTIVECKKLGVPSLGFEAHPWSQFVAQTKTIWDVIPGDLVEAASAIEGKASRVFKRQGIETLSNSIPSDLALRELTIDEHKLLIKGSIDPLPLHRVLTLRDMIRAKSKGKTRNLLILALARALPTKIGNLHFGPEVGARGSRLDADVIGEWLKNVNRFAADLTAYRITDDVTSTVVHTDSRTIEFPEYENAVSAVITSPPYPNEKDYTRTVRLESVVMGYMSDKSELRRIKKRLLRSNTRNVYVADTDDTFLPVRIPELEHVAAEIEDRRIRMGKDSGFEKNYAKVTMQYFGGMARHLEGLKSLLKPGAKLAYVVGDQASYLRVLIRTGHLLSEIANSLGYESERIDLFRTRRATATRSELREEVLVLRWPG